MRRAAATQFETFGLIRLLGWPEQDLVDVDVLRLAHRKDNRSGKRVGRDRNLVIERVDALGDGGVGYRAGQFGRDRAGEMIVVRML